MASHLFSLLVFSLAINAAICTPWVPEGRGDEWWLNMHNAFVEQTRNSNNGEIKAIFFGASITDWWPDQLFNDYFGSKGAVNYGVSGDGVEHALYRMMNGEVDPKLASSLKLIVLADVGSNNIANGRDSPDDIVHGYTVALEYLRSVLPNTKILLLGLMPRDDGNIERAMQMMDINIKNSKNDNGDGGSRVKYLDLWTQFSQKWGVVEPGYFLDDKLHLTEAGYRRWAQVLEPAFNSMMN